MKYLLSRPSGRVRADWVSSFHRCLLSPISGVESDISSSLRHICLLRVKVMESSDQK